MNKPEYTNGPPPRVRTEVGYKKNMGAGTFETLTLEFSVEDNCRRKDDGWETVDEAFNRVAEYVEGQLLDRLSELVEEVGVINTGKGKKKK